MAFLKFLGTAGARFVMIEQLRASGGIWINYKDTNILVDPGPGSIVRCCESKPKLNLAMLKGIILTHRHLDHANDINVMIEAMTEGGFKKRGLVFCPADAIKTDPVILKHVLGFPEEIITLKPCSAYKVGDFRFKTSMPHKHPAETYGIKFKMGKSTVALLTDTAYFKELNNFYKADILIISVVFFEPRLGVEHLSLPDAKEIIRRTKPKKAILTHFGRSMLKANPNLQAKILSKQLGIEVVAAYDGLQVDFSV
jgi:ribonuclease BN (tRNA processing enzyme)